MSFVYLQTETLAVLIAGLYSTYGDVNPMAIPQSLWLEIAEKLEPYLDEWDYETLSFEDWIKYNLFIYPTIALDDETLDDIKKSTIFFERINGIVLLSVSMDMEVNDWDSRDSIDTS